MFFISTGAERFAFGFTVDFAVVYQEKKHENNPKNRTFHTHHQHPSSFCCGDIDADCKVALKAGRGRNFDPCASRSINGPVSSPAVVSLHIGVRRISSTADAPGSTPRACPRLRAWPASRGAPRGCGGIGRTSATVDIGRSDRIAGLRSAAGAAASWVPNCICVQLRLSPGSSSPGSSGSLQAR